MTQVPCRDCKQRSPTCHAECEKYRAFRDEMDRRLAEGYARKLASKPLLPCRMASGWLKHKDH